MDDISVQELNERLKKKEEIILIDVRETHEHQEFNIGGELATLQTDLPLKILELAGHEDDEIIVYCRSGNRSCLAKQLFEKAGFKRVRNLLGGMLSWKENLPA